MLTIRQEAARRERNYQMLSGAFWGCTGGWLAVIVWVLLRGSWATWRVAASWLWVAGLR